EATETVTVEVTTTLTGYNIPLEKGWNLISLPLIPDDSRIESVLANVLDDVISVWKYIPKTDDKPADWSVYSTGPDAPIDLTTMGDGVGYWVNLDEAGTMVLSGLETPLPPDGPHEYNVVVGWNLIGFKEV
ncbi:unnamed protein product, partial [marine sediment metagenome]